MAATVLTINTIVSDAAVRGGRPIIAGTSLRVSDVVASHIFRGHTPEELAVQFKLRLGEVHAALAYYFMHKDEIDQELRDNAAQAEQLLNEFDAAGKLTRIE